MRTARLAAALPLLAALSLGGCAGLTPAQQRTGTGALGGGAVGALLGSFGGNAGLGALLGAAAGGAGGYLFDQSQQAQQRAYLQGRADARRAARYRDAGGPYY